MIPALLSVLIITIAVWVINKKLPIQICPICAGVTLTWAWLLFGMWSGLLSVPRYEFLTAVFMGASIGGIVTEIKKLFLKFRSTTKSEKIKEVKKQLDNCC